MHILTPWQNLYNTHKKELCARTHTHTNTKQLLINKTRKKLDRTRLSHSLSCEAQTEYVYGNDAVRL